MAITIEGPFLSKDPNLKGYIMSTSSGFYDEQDLDQEVIKKDKEIFNPTSLFRSVRGSQSPLHFRPELESSIFIQIILDFAVPSIQFR